MQPILNNAAINTGPSTHLDHLAPICFALGIPLIVTDRDHFELSQRLYPMVDLKYVPFSDLSLEYLAKEFETIMTCGKFWAMELKPLLQLIHGKTIRFVFAPHGYSDKEALLNQPVKQDISLVYKGDGPNEIAMGNIRYWFYKKFQAHFDALTAHFFKSTQKTVLYAPTWETKATGTSFFDKMDEVVRLCEGKYQLLVKLHPLLEENDPARFYRIIETYKEMVTFIENFPPVYPLLARTDIYLGDYSSIGYDFLVFNRPLFFLKQGGQLQQCGQLLEGSLDDLQEDLGEKRKCLYEGTFGNIIDIEKFKKSYSSMLSCVSG